MGKYAYDGAADPSNWVTAQWRNLGWLYDPTGSQTTLAHNPYAEPLWDNPTYGPITDPSDFDDLNVCLIADPTFGTCFTDSLMGTPVSGGAVGYVKPLYGTTIALEQTTANEQPILYWNGLGFDDVGGQEDNMAFSSNIVVGPTVTDFTAYMGLRIVDGGDGLVFAGRPTTPFASLQASATSLGWFQDAGTTTHAWNSLAKDNSYAMARIGWGAVDGSSGNMIATGSTSTNPPITAKSTFEQIGELFTTPIGTSEENARWRFFIIYNRHIPLDSNEDLRIRDWIYRNLGNTLSEPDWTPEQVDNLEIGLDLRVGNIWQDVAQTTPADTEGNPVRFSPAMWGTTRNAIKASGNAPVVSSIVNQAPLGICAPGLGGINGMDLSSSLTIDGPFTFYGVGWTGNIQGGNNMPWLSKDHASELDGIGFISQGAGSGNHYFVNSDYSQVHGPSLSSIPNDEIFVVRTRRDSDNKCWTASSVLGFGTQFGGQTVTDDTILINELIYWQSAAATHNTNQNDARMILFYHADLGEATSEDLAVRAFINKEFGTSL